MNIRRVLPLILLVTLTAPVTLVPAFPASGRHGKADLGSFNMLHLANRHRTVTTNTDLAFWSGPPIRGPFKDLAFAGNYNGFRIFDIADPANPILVSDFWCRGPQGDVSVHQAQDRLLLILSIDQPQTTAECASSADTPVMMFPDPITGIPQPFFVPGFEGLRIFDVTDPTTPRQIASVPTACGSHTHTTIPDRNNQRLIIYVSSFPLGAEVTPAEADFDGPRCTLPHAKISIVEVPLATPEMAQVLKEQPLHEDTLPFQGTVGQGGTGAVGCHDITVYLDPASKRQVAAAACLSEGQLWDVTDPANPTTLTTHSHIRNPFIHTQSHIGNPSIHAGPMVSGMFHSAAFTWDGKVILFGDEWHGGVGHGCDGPEDHRGNIWFYQAVAPGTPLVPVLGRYMIPRPQPADKFCTLHNFIVIPLINQDRYVGVSASYEGGTTVFDFSRVTALPPRNIEDLLPSQIKQPIPLAGAEIAFSDAQGEDRRMRDDTWSSYWYNDHIWVSGGLGGIRPELASNRGFDVYLLLDEKGQQLRARKFQHLNPQTQEVFQPLGSSRGD